MMGVIKHAWNQDHWNQHTQQKLLENQSLLKNTPYDQYIREKPLYEKRPDKESIERFNQNRITINSLAEKIESEVFEEYYTRSSPDSFFERVFVTNVMPGVNHRKSMLLVRQGIVLKYLAKKTPMHGKNSVRLNVGIIIKMYMRFDCIEHIAVFSSWYKSDKKLLWGLTFDPTDSHKLFCNKFVYRMIPAYCCNLSIFLLDLYMEYINLYFIDLS
jgi:hypothetical protein